MANSPYVINVTADDFHTRVVDASHQVPVLVDFWAEWCQPCRMLGPILDDLADTYGGKLLVAKVDTEADKDLAAQFGIRSLPTVKLFKDGQPVDEFMGALPEGEIRAFLDPHLPRESDNLLLQAEALLAQGDPDKAAELVEKIRENDANNPRLNLFYARLKAVQGDYDAAEKALDALPLEQHDSAEAQALRATMTFDRATAGSASAEELAQRLEANPDDSEARYQFAALKVMERDYETALENLLTLLRKDRKYGDDAARKAMVQVFDLLGGEGDLVTRYRAKMMTALY